MSEGFVAMTISRLIERTLAAWSEGYSGAETLHGCSPSKQERYSLIAFLTGKTVCHSSNPRCNSNEPNS